jgi:diguanylate cyclase (GGDEF)-like protein
VESNGWSGREHHGTDKPMTWRRPHRVTVFILGLTAFFVAMLAMGAGALTLSNRLAALSDAEAQTVRFTNGASMALNRNLLGVDIVLATLDELLGLSESMVDWIDLPTASVSITRIAQQNMLLRNLSLLDAHGKMLATSDPAGTSLNLNLPPGYLDEVLAYAVSTLVISAPAVSFSSSEPVLYMARHIHMADATRVVAVAEVPLVLLTNIMVQGVDLPGLEVTLERANGAFLASMPVQTAASKHPLVPLLKTPQPDGKPVRMAARLSGQPAIVVARPILYRGVLVAASLPVDAALTSWRTQRNFILGAAIIFAIMIVSAGGFAINYLARLTEARQNLASSKAEVDQLAFFDPLTGLPNRRLLMDRLQKTLSANARSGQLGALLFLDLDRFKTLNDTMGHDVGDELLRQVGQRLMTTVRNIDTVARLGGDEFVVMLTDLTTENSRAVSTAQRVGQKLLASLNEPYQLGGYRHLSTPSIGATVFGNEVQSLTDVLKQADIAMYQVKAGGRNGLCFFDPKMQADITARADLESDLRLALAEEQFQLFYQPQHQLFGHVVGAEVLIRWHHPRRGMVPPGEFIPVAEDSELILPIGEWVLRTACQQLAAWRDNPIYQNLLLSVNVSARQFLQTSFVQDVTSILQETGVAPQSLKLELTESLVLENVEGTIRKMTELKALGVQFSVDDFGTGHSSLAYLTRLPLDQLKIDQSFVRNIGIKDTDGVIVQTIIGMARNLGLEVIAEGVETEEQREFLALHGCTMYQGYLFGKPMPLDAFEAMLSNTQSTARRG